MNIEFTGEYKDYRFSDEEKVILRPIAETLAMIDGNAFFTMPLGAEREFYEQYLPEAAEIFFGNGGWSGWASEASWVKEHLLRKKHPALEYTWERYLVVKALLDEDVSDTSI